MARRKKSRKPIFSLARGAWLSVWGLVFLALTIVLVLAGFGQAGSAGEFLFHILFALLGWGYVLLPITLLGISLNFLVRQSETETQTTTWIGSALFLLSTLGFIDVLQTTWGGMIGSLTGYPQTWFSPFAWGIVLFILSIISIVIVLNKPLHLEFKRSEKKKEDPKATFAKLPKEEEPEDEEEEIEEEEEEEEDEEFVAAPPTRKSAKPITSGAIQKFPDYKAPPVELLRSAMEKPSAGDLRANANIIKRTLESFGIPVEMGEINIGPKVTRYTLRPAEGIKLSRITALNQDLALALSAHPIRIEAPIPGKPYVGIEVPNKTAAIVRLGNLISYPEFAQSGPLGFPLGRDVTGDPLFVNIEKMPHVLIAGATGSGKSITLHSLLISLLYKNSPQTLRLILIDPKRVELSAYNDIPHLITPVITQGKKSFAVFRWAIAEMDRRYELLLKAGARDIQSYNKKHPEESLPYLVMVVDEMADLMAAYGRDIENAVVRLAQMARATGIHLVLSTQRPSVEVITGLIKANITGRVALQVASQVDSRTILDASGAEKLLGGGDLLFISSEFSKPKRLQGAYISEEEIQTVTNFIKEQNAGFSIDEENVSLDQEDHVAHQPDIFDGFEDTEEEDDLLPEAIELVKETQKASASFLQRKLKVGYARAARLLDLMEDKGLVGPADGAKPREVYISSEEA